MSEPRDSDGLRRDDTFVNGDPLAPEQIEGTILAAQTADVSETQATRLVRALATAYALPPGADAALARVHARLAAATLAPESVAEEEADSFASEQVERRWGLGPLPAHTRRASRLGASLRAIAAVLVVALLGAGFYAALHRQGGGPPPSYAEQPGWHDVGITQARATQPLNFDPAQGATYAVSEVTGDIYACGGAGHIWYSTNGGASYAPFPVIPPTIPQGSVSCTIATVPGASGLFTRLVDASGPTQSVAHISLPGRLTAPLQPPTSAVSPVDASVRTTVDPDQFLSPMFAGGMIGSVRMAGNWLYAMVWDDQLSRTVLLGTADFGRHWYWLDAPITAHSPAIIDWFAVNPSDPSRLFLGVRPNATADGLPSIAMSTDGGKTWRPLPYDSPYGMALAGASDTAVFGFTQDDSAGHAALLQLDLTRPNAGWQRVAQLPSSSGMLAVGMLEVGSDGTVYDVREGSTMPRDTVRAYTLAPGASAFRLVWPQATFTLQDRFTAFALGGIWPGERPALYVNSSSGPSSGPSLYRLALSDSAEPSGTPTP